MSKSDKDSHLKDMRILRNVRVPMRDGVELSTNVYLPLGDGPFPVVLVRMAYNRAWITGSGWAERGIALVSQDTRGRYASDGEFEPFVNETEDGWDTLEWLKAQSWCDGRVGMFGDSYLGGVQFAVAPLNHPLVVALNPRFIAGDLWQCGYYCDGAFSLALTFSWLCLEVNSRSSEANLLPLFDVEGLLKQLPLLTIDEKSGAASKFYREYVTHWARDAYWARQSYRAQLGKCRTPNLLTAGWYDYYPGETFRNYQALLDGADGDEELKRSHRVLVGPWMHGMNPGSKLGEIDYGENATAENLSTHRWLETMLKGGRPEEYGKAPIRIFVMGENVWRDEYEWPLKRTQFTAYYLHSRGKANGAGTDGSLSTSAPSREQPDQFTYDPANPVGTYGGNHSVGPYNPGLYELALPGPYDQKKTEARDDVLVYASDVLAEDLELTGPVELKLFASTSARDTDFVARLTDVYPDGRSMNITEGVIRGRFRERHWARPALLESGKAYEFTIELQPTSNVFKKGHRLRLQVTSSNFPLWDRNLNTGGDPATETRMVVAKQTVFHDGEHPSHLVLPVAPRR